MTRNLLDVSACLRPAVNRSNPWRQVSSKEGRAIATPAIARAVPGSMVKPVCGAAESKMEIEEDGNVEIGSATMRLRKRCKKLKRAWRIGWERVTERK